MKHWFVTIYLIELVYCNEIQMTFKDVTFSAQMVDADTNKL